MVIGFRSAGRSGDCLMAEDQAPLPDRSFAALHPNADAQAGLAAIGRAVEAATATGCAALQEAEPRRALRATILDTAHRLMALAEPTSRAHESCDLRAFRRPRPGLRHL